MKSAINIFYEVDLGKGKGCMSCPFLHEGIVIFQLKKTENMPEFKQ